MTSLFSFPIRVYWEDTDAGGVVYHASYLRFLERARTEWLRAQGVGQQRMRDEHDLVLAVREMRIDFLKPGRLDDDLVVTVELVERRRASLLFQQQVSRDGLVLLQAEVRIACLVASDFKPRALPEWLARIPEPNGN